MRWKTALLFHLEEDARWDIVPQLVNPLIKSPTVYYENLSPHLVRSVQPATTNNFYAYHPLTQMDSSAFDHIQIDAGAYEYIDGHLNHGSISIDDCLCTCNEILYVEHGYAFPQ